MPCACWPNWASSAMTDKVRQILQAAELLRKGDVATGMKQIMGATSARDLHTIEAPDPLAVSLALGAPQHSAQPLGRGDPQPVAPPSGQGTPQPFIPPAGQGSQQSGFPPLGQVCTSVASNAGAPVGVQPHGLDLADFTNCISGFGMLGCGTMPAIDQSADASAAAALGIDPDRLRLAQTVGAMRLKMIQEAAQQHYLAVFAQQAFEAQQLHEKQQVQQEAAQLALIMEAAEVQAEMAKQALHEDQEEHHWHRRLGKQKVCGHWQRGHCQRGISCSFSHPEKERGTLQTRGPADLMRHNFKTMLCKFFMAGSCPHGARCMFAHGPQDLRSQGMSLSRDEEEMVQRVATSKTTKGPPAPCPSGQTPTVVAPRSNVAAESALALLGSPAPQVVPPAGWQLQGDAAALMTLAGLSELGVDPSSFDLSQLASWGMAATACPLQVMGGAAAAPAPAARPQVLPPGLQPQVGSLQPQVVAPATQPQMLSTGLQPQVVAPPPGFQQQQQQQQLVAAVLQPQISGAVPQQQVAEPTFQQAAPQTSGPVRMAPPQISAEALALLERSQRALNEGPAKRPRVGES